MQAPRSPKVKPKRSPSTLSPASSNQRSVDETTDKRLLRGERSRKLVLARAVDIASLESLEGLSFGRLATETGMSKAGIQALFETKQTLQQDTFAYAVDMFRDFVVRPAEAKPQGVHRFRELIDRWLQYAEQPLFAGGCFFAANLVQFDFPPRAAARPGGGRSKSVGRPTFHRVETCGQARRYRQPGSRARRVPDRSRPPFGEHRVAARRAGRDAQGMARRG